MNSTRITCVFTAVVFATMLSSAALMSPGAQASGRCLPSDIVDLQGWKLTVPLGTPAQDITQPALSVYESAHFGHLPDCTALVFKTPIGGTTTPNSSYPRTELREMTPDGTKLASWSNTSGTHEMSWRVAVDTAPSAKPQFVLGQVHDAEDDVVQVLYDVGEGDEEGGAITYRWLGKTSGMLVSGYQTGTYVDLRIVASDGAFKLYANGELKATTPSSPQRRVVLQGWKLSAEQPG